ncbi:hypothetical protein [Streptomyces sp. enrichment culture]|uniref:hypothetical protein n=1 Tax=Streptomyces sp. enrichment culture TaxID=1795815 RepID=UPI003F573683
MSEMLGTQATTVLPPSGPVFIGGSTGHGSERATPGPEALGEAVGRIAAYAAQSLHESFPHLDLDELVETFTRPSAVRMLTARYLRGLESGLPAGEAAAAAGTRLIHAWADARLAARAELDRAKAAASS